MLLPAKLTPLMATRQSPTRSAPVLQQWTRWHTQVLCTNTCTDTGRHRHGQAQTRGGTDTGRHRHGEAQTRAGTDTGRHRHGHALTRAGTDTGRHRHGQAQTRAGTHLTAAPSCLISETTTFLPGSSDPFSRSPHFSPGWRASSTV